MKASPDAVETVGSAVDWAGVGVIVGGILLATALALAAVRRGTTDEIYRHYRQRVGKSILLGLEFLVAADIIRTVAARASAGLGCWP